MIILKIIAVIIILFTLALTAMGLYFEKIETDEKKNGFKEF